MFFPWGNIPKEVEKKKREHRRRSEMSLKVEKLRKGNTVAGEKYPQRSRKEEKGTPSPVGNVPKSGKIKKRVYRPRREMSLKVEKLRKGYTSPGGKYPQRSKKEKKGYFHVKHLTKVN